MKITYRRCFGFKSLFQKWEDREVITESVDYNPLNWALYVFNPFMKVDDIS